jgi:hypothetical protein
LQHPPTDEMGGKKLKKGEKVNEWPRFN